MLGMLWHDMLSEAMNFMSFWHVIWHVSMLLNVFVTCQCQEDISVATSWHVMTCHNKCHHRSHIAGRQHSQHRVTEEIQNILKMFAEMFSLSLTVTGVKFLLLYFLSFSQATSIIGSIPEFLPAELYAASASARCRVVLDTQRVALHAHNSLGPIKLSGKTFFP